MPVSKQGSTSGRFALEVNGGSVGFLKYREGGNPSGIVIKETVNPSFFVGKHLADFYYEPLVLQCDLSLDKSLYEWIGAAWQGKHVARHGRITTFDVNHKPLGEQGFFQALITETTIPALDAASKEPAYLTVSLQSERVKLKFNQGATPPPVKVPKSWQVSNFLLNIDGLECKRVSKIDSFSVKQTIIKDDVGVSREPRDHYLPIDFPDLHVTLPLADFQTWYDWFTAFVELGQSDAAHEKTGYLVFLAPDRKTELARINFFGLGIYKLVPAVNQDQQVVASLYCERMEFVYPSPPA